GGGTYENGNIFAYDPQLDDFSVIHEFQTYLEAPYFSDLIEVEHDFGINELEENLLQFTISPNPAKDQILISCPEIEGKFQLCIFDITGKLILIENRTDDFKCDIPDLDSGIYTVRISSANRTGIQKLIVN
ncbi:MAG: hypothetical protein DRJ15_09565, partial [Bacteroidetes bacterium]